MCDAVAFTESSHQLSISEEDRWTALVEWDRNVTRECHSAVSALSAPRTSASFSIMANYGGEISSLVSRTPASQKNAPKIVAERVGVFDPAHRNPNKNGRLLVNSRRGNRLATSPSCADLRPLALGFVLC